jgi:hypothetical protein
MVLHRTFGWLAVMTATSWMTCPALAQPSTVKVEEAIAWVRAEDRPGRIGLATIWDGNKFVQCRGIKGGDLRCEAAGALMQPSLSRVLTPERIGRLAAMGWKLDPSFGNYVRIFKPDAPNEDVAGQLLAALQQGYDANPQDLDFQRQSYADVLCPPRNVISQSHAGAINPRPRSRSAVSQACAYRPNRSKELVAEPRLGPGSTAADLIALYGPTVTAEIARLRANKHHRVFAAFETGLGYVQCQPFTDPDSFYCEAQSTDSWPALAAVLTPERIARLHAAGYADPGRAPNYSKIYRADAIDDAALAREILTLLHDVYGYYGASELKIMGDKSRK